MEIVEIRSCAKKFGLIVYRCTYSRRPSILVSSNYKTQVYAISVNPWVQACWKTAYQTDLRFSHLFFPRDFDTVRILIPEVLISCKLWVVLFTIDKLFDGIAFCEELKSEGKTGDDSAPHGELNFWSGGAADCANFQDGSARGTIYISNG